MPPKRKTTRHSLRRTQPRRTSLRIQGKRVHKTFLFTDIVKSTDIRAAYIREWGDKGNERYDNEILAPHDEILNQLIPQFNGEVVSTEGDSYFAAFIYARDAVECAVAVQRDFTKKGIRLPPVEASLPHHLQIRVGLNTGGAQEVLRAGKPNYSDHTINIAARIKSHALGEQVLMSQETWSNTGRLKGISKHEWKNYPLSGVDGLWTLVEVLWDGREPRQPQMSPPTPSSTSVATIAAFDIFGGHVEISTDDLLSHPANSKRVLQFYAGAKLDWDIITAHGDIPRDPQDELLKQASQPFEGMRLICIAAEAGAGKSTLAWRVAAELHQQHKVLIIHIKDNDDADVWYRLPEFCAKVGRPFCVLVDDVFHDPDAADAFHELSPWLPITVLATSRLNEYRARRLKCETSRFDMKPPSSDEKERILKKLGKSRGDLTADQQHRLDAANQFLVLMMELTEGKELREIVRDTLERLHELDEAAYRAYEYLCFGYQHSIAMPVSLLERLDEHGHFHNLLGRETTQGLIFWDSREGCVRVGHPVIAETAAVFYVQSHSPKAVLTEMAAAVDAANAFERRFFAHLLRILAQGKSPILTPMPEPLQRTIADCVASAGRMVELIVWRTFYRHLGQDEQANKCIDLALTFEPISSWDCNMLLKLCRERGKEHDALPAISKWVRNHPDQSEPRTAYLGLVARYGTANDVETVLTETSTWLAAHPENPSVRTAYLGLVERKGTDKQIAQVVNETSTWLAAHQDNTHVRGCYLGLVERKGTTEQVAQVVKETSEWLATHQDDSNVRTAHLGLVERKGTPEQVAQAVQETSAWFAAHPDDVNVRQAWLSFVEVCGPPNLKEATILDTKVWLAQHPSAKEVWVKLLGCLFRADRRDEAVELALTAISHHPNSQNLLAHYLQAVQINADEQSVRNVYEQLLAKYPQDLACQARYASWLREQGHLNEAEQRYQILIAQGLRFHGLHYGYGLLLLKLERFDKAATEFRKALKIHRGHQMAHEGLALALWKLGDFRQAEREFHSALYWAAIQGKPQAKFYTDLGWFYLDHQRWQDALHAFESARNEDLDYFGNYWGIGKALMGIKDYRAAADSLRNALEKEPNLKLPASEEIPELVRQCLEHLKRNH